MDQEHLGWIVSGWRHYLLRSRWSASRVSSSCSLVALHSESTWPSGGLFVLVAFQEWILRPHRWSLCLVNVDWNWAPSLIKSVILPLNCQAYIYVLLFPKCTTTWGEVAQSKEYAFAQCSLRRRKGWRFFKGAWFLLTDGGSSSREGTQIQICLGLLKCVELNETSLGTGSNLF